MAADASQQETLFGETRRKLAEVETTARVLRPALGLIHPLVEEYGVHVEESGLSVSAVDPANVALIDLTLTAAAFDRFDLSKRGTVGVAAATITRGLNAARYGAETDDAIEVVFGDGYQAATVERDYDGTALTQRTEWLTLDPASLREEPDIPDLDLPNETVVSAAAFEAAIERCDAVSDVAHFTMRDGSFVLAAEGDTSATEVTFDTPVQADEPAASSMVSLDYLKDIASALRFGSVLDEVVVKWGDTYPITIGFERVIDGETAYRGQYAVAPRRESDS